ncbi:MAG: cytochrome c-type biogenesis protein CcmH [Arenicellales bacterium]|nr:cytochrome c-type biogenesis protein CcmH [Arenicellales bacterium]
MKKLMVVTFAVLICCCPSVWAKVEVLQFDSVEQERRYNQLIEELRCLVCQNQNLADSNADLAKDLREKTYQMIKAGSSNEEIVDYMVDRYGDFVLYRPPVKLSTVILWTGPFVLLLIGLWVLVRLVRQRRNQPVATLSQEQHEQAQRLLHED